MAVDVISIHACISSFNIITIVSSSNDHFGYFLYNNTSTLILNQLLDHQYAIYKQVFEDRLSCLSIILKLHVLFLQT